MRASNLSVSESAHPRTRIEKKSAGENSSQNVVFGDRHLSSAFLRSTALIWFPRVATRGADLGIAADVDMGCTLGLMAAGLRGPPQSRERERQTVAVASTA